MRNREGGAGLMGNNDGAIHTKYGAAHTKDVEVHVHNGDIVGPDSAYSATGIFCITNRNGMSAVKGTNQNEAEGVDFAALIDGTLENVGKGNQITVQWTLCFGKIDYLPYLYSTFLDKALQRYIISINLKFKR